MKITTAKMGKTTHPPDFFLPINAMHFSSEILKRFPVRWNRAFGNWGCERRQKMEPGKNRHTHTHSHDSVGTFISQNKRRVQYCCKHFIQQFYRPASLLVRVIVRANERATNTTQRKKRTENNRREKKNRSMNQTRTLLSVRRPVGR